MNCYCSLKGEDGGCYSSVGRRGGKQVLNLQKYPIEQGCFQLATIMHEYLHGELDKIFGNLKKIFLMLNSYSSWFLSYAKCL